MFGKNTMVVMRSHIQNGIIVEMEYPSYFWAMRSVMEGYLPSDLTKIEYIDGDNILRGDDAELITKYERSNRRYKTMVLAYIDINLDRSSQRRNIETLEAIAETFEVEKVIMIVEENLPDLVDSRVVPYDPDTEALLMACGHAFEIIE